MEHDDRLEVMLTAYIECALWSTTDNSRDDGGDPLDQNYGPEDLAPEARETMERACAEFLKASDAAVIEGCAAALMVRRLHLTDREAAVSLADAHETWEQFGHDFWLTRNGHGAGFWDRPEIYGAQMARLLTQASKTRGECHVSVGDDGRLYVD